MKSFFDTLKPSLLLLLFFTVLLGVIYPVFVWGVGQIFFSRKANGSLLYSQSGTIIGSEWIAQPFTLPRYFHPRFSAAGEWGYDAVHSSGSNLGPTAEKLAVAYRKRAAEYRLMNELSSLDAIPADAIAASGSGLDPEISVANALLQAPRVAAARNLSLVDVEHLIDQYREGDLFEFFGTGRINVLRINLALDKLK